MKKTLTDSDIRLFALLRSPVLEGLNHGIDKVLEVNQKAWNKKKVRERLFFAISNYIKCYFNLKIAYVPEDFKKMQKYNNRGFY